MYYYHVSTIHDVNCLFTLYIVLLLPVCIHVLLVVDFTRNRKANDFVRIDGLDVDNIIGLHLLLLRSSLICNLI
jgi:hypothetical protein